MTVENVYCTRRDVFVHGLPRGTVGMRARELASVTAATDLFELDEHGFEDDDELLFRAAEGGTLATPIVAGTPYYAKRISAATFKIAATRGGAAIDITADGVTMFAAIALPFDEVMEFFSRWIDSVIPHKVPLTAPYPVIVVGTCAKLSAKELQRLSGHTSVAMAEAMEEAKTLLGVWATGDPIRDAKATRSTNNAVARTAKNDRGWPSGELP